MHYLLNNSEPTKKQCTDDRKWSKIGRQVKDLWSALTSQLFFDDKNFLRNEK